MYDKSLIAHLLPSEMIIKNYIHGDPDCNYEKYLLEFVNASDFFRAKSDGDIYQSPESEENGQCDLISTALTLPKVLLICDYWIIVGSWRNMICTYLQLHLGFVEYHEMWHAKQADDFRNAGWKITEDNYGDYLKNLCEKVKKRLDKADVNAYNADEISEYASGNFVKADMTKSKRIIWQ